MQNQGVNYRALGDLFLLAEQRRNTCRYDVSVQMIEIYNEQVRDLLVTDGPNKRYPSIIIGFLPCLCLEFRASANCPVQNLIEEVNFQIVIQIYDFFIGKCLDIKLNFQ